MPIMAKYKIAFQSSGNLTPFQTSLIFDLVLATNEQFISSVGSFSRDLSIERFDKLRSPVSKANIEDSTFSGVSFAKRTIAGNVVYAL